MVVVERDTRKTGFVKLQHAFCKCHLRLPVQFDADNNAQHRIKTYFLQFLVPRSVLNT